MSSIEQHPPASRWTLGARLAIYALVTAVVCLLAAILGEAFFPAELIGDTGANDFAGLAAILWAGNAFALCAVASIAFESGWQLRHRLAKRS